MTTITVSPAELAQRTADTLRESADTLTDLHAGMPADEDALIVGELAVAVWAVVVKATRAADALHAYRGREHAVACALCGVRRGKPATTTWNLSSQCDRHEAIDKLVDQGYGRQVAMRIVSRATPPPVQRGHS